MPVKSIAQNMRMLVLDVDGVLTDAGLYLDGQGNELKRFNAQDGLGIKILLRMGIQVGVITGLKSKAVRARMEALGVTDYAEGVEHKLRELDAMRQKYKLTWQEMAYVGDDWIDLAPLHKVGLPIAVANAQKEVKDVASYITTASGGHGAVREVVRLLLESQGRLNEALSYWTKML